MSFIIDIDKDIDQLRKSKAGIPLLINGTIYSARDAAHKRLKELIEKGEPLPIDLKNRILYYMGPTPAKEGNVIGSCGPTSSYRMDDFFEMTLELGIAASIGKGSRAPFVKELIKKYKSPYLITIGGAGAYLAKCVVSSRVIAFEDLGAEAITELVVKEFPVIVGIDFRGNQIFT
ncbi:MAG TPA: TRZ/ATZ family protein [Spirochaetia bacterium]|nr:TRZ/ATZ family protein [Spirochaetia bacterium]HBI37983.1 TRZ/ATZ family protein [Spirochaetia bacterium]